MHTCKKKEGMCLILCITSKFLSWKTKPLVKNKPSNKIRKCENVTKSNCKTGEGQPLLNLKMPMNSARENAEPLQYPSWRNCELPTNVARKSAERPQDLPLWNPLGPWENAGKSAKRPKNDPWRHPQVGRDHRSKKCRATNRSSLPKILRQEPNFGRKSAERPKNVPQHHL